MPQLIALLTAAIVIAVTVAAARGLAGPSERTRGSAENAPSRVVAPPRALTPTATAATATARFVSLSSAPAAPANDPTIDLCATTGTLALPGNVSVPIWGFVAKAAAPDCSDVRGSATLPGPVLDVHEGDIVHLNVTNDPSLGRTISIEVPGIGFDPGGTDADPGQTVQRTFTAGAPGTYLYQSVGDGERQTAMGLYGALIVRPNTTGQAYDDPASAYDVEAGSAAGAGGAVVLSEIDPAFNADPDGFDMHAYRATYWLINGKAYPQTDPIQASAGQRVLLRYINAGFDNTTMMLLGLHEHVIARDAQVLPNPFDANAETIPAGGTEDTVATVPSSSSGLPNGFPLYNRQLHLANGTADSPSYSSPGGMMTFIQSP
jgi:FtsP/CotA-like multicopper oxidase with cupredoxin domain